jgi:hypothetical protein
MNKSRLPLQAVIMILTLSSSLGFAQTLSSETPPARLPEVTVTGTQPLNEEQPVGANQQPEWTARRRFVTTRVYVQPPWQVEMETGWDATFSAQRHGSSPADAGNRAWAAPSVAA